jgi:hypothetical protein
LRTIKNRERRKNMNDLADHLRTTDRRETIDEDWCRRLLAEGRPRPKVYFIAWADGPVKIGWTKNVQHRLHQIQASCPFDLDLLAVREGPKELELAYHRRFDPWRLRGEWFERHPLLLNEIGKLNKTVRGNGMLFPPRPRHKPRGSSHDQ